MYRIGPIGRKPNFHFRERFLIGLVLVTLCFLCFAGIFLLPDNFGGESVLKVYKHLQKTGPEIFIPAPPLAGTGFGSQDVEPRSLGDREKLQAKIKEELGDIMDKPETVKRPEYVGPPLEENVGAMPVIDNDLSRQQQQLEEVKTLDKQQERQNLMKMFQQQIRALQDQQQQQVIGAMPPPLLKNSINDDTPELAPAGDSVQVMMPMGGHHDPSPTVDEQRKTVKEVSQRFWETVNIVAK